VLLSDTVGFIRDLPHHLIASFKATLEEARRADLLIHVADASNPAALDQILAVYDVLREIGIEEKDTLLALNKIDRVDDPTRIEALRNRYPHAVCFSAITGEGLPRLASAVSDALSHDFLDLELQFDSADGRLLAYLARHGEVLSRTFFDNRVVVHCRISQSHLGQLQRPGTQVRPYSERALPCPTEFGSNSASRDEVA
jgi:GTP-binding protein HflX